MKLEHRRNYPNLSSNIREGLTGFGGGLSSQSALLLFAIVTKR